MRKTGRALLATLVGCSLLLLSAPLAPADPGPRVIGNRVSRKSNWAAGTFDEITNDVTQLTLNTSPKDGDQLSDKESTLDVKDSRMIWQVGQHTKERHVWTAQQVLGKRVVARVLGEFIVSGTGGGTPPQWYSHSLDVDLDIGNLTGRDNTPDEDKQEMDVGRCRINPGNHDFLTLRTIDPPMSEKRTELQPSVKIHRSHNGVGLFFVTPEGAKGASIFPAGKNESDDLTNYVLQSDATPKNLPLWVEGSVIGDCILTAVLRFTDPSSKYPCEFRDPVRVTITGALRCDIDVDSNRNGAVHDTEDDAQEDAPIDFLQNTGALVLVNCDADRGGNEARDMDDLIINIINGDDDKLDMSPLSLELKNNLAAGETLWLVVRNVDGSEKPWVGIHDPERTDPAQTFFAGGNSDPPVAECRMDNIDIGGGKTWFPNGNAARYDRFLIEGLWFGKEVLIDLEIRNGAQVIERDTVRVLTCPWLANNNTQPLANCQQWSIPGNLIDSQSYTFAADHGATKVTAGALLEFVQDSAEWGFQVRRQNPAADSRTMITALRLATHEGVEDQHPRLQFLNGKVGVYGYRTTDEQYFTAGDGGDQGGNLECLPPSDENPFGRILHGDTMTATLRAFLAQQKVQVRGGAAIIPIKNVGLGHVDEIACVLNNGKVVMPDWGLARNLLGDPRYRNRRFSVPLPSGVADNKYALVLTWLNNAGKEWNKRFQKGLDDAQAQMRSFGATVVKMPGMYFEYATDGVQRSFPRNIANSQPTTNNKLITVRPPDDPPALENLFFGKWRQDIPPEAVVEGEDSMHFAWTKKGEAHCSSNTIREPIKK